MIGRGGDSDLPLGVSSWATVPDALPSLGATLRATVLSRKRTLTGQDSMRNIRSSEYPQNPRALARERPLFAFITKICG